MKYNNPMKQITTPSNNWWQTSKWEGGNLVFVN